MELLALHSSVLRMARSSSKLICSALFHLQACATFQTHRLGSTVVLMIASGRYATPRSNLTSDPGIPSCGGTGVSDAPPTCSDHHLFHDERTTSAKLSSFPSFPMLAGPLPPQGPQSPQTLSHRSPPVGHSCRTLPFPSPHANSSQWPLHLLGLYAPASSTATDRAGKQPSLCESYSQWRLLCPPPVALSPPHLRALSCA